MSEDEVTPISENTRTEQKKKVLKIRFSIFKNKFQKMFQYFEKKLDCLTPFFSLVSHP